MPVPPLPLPLPLPIAAEGGGASFRADCWVLLEPNMELMSAGFWLLYEPLAKDGIPWLGLGNPKEFTGCAEIPEFPCWGAFSEDMEALLNAQLSLLAD